MLAFAEGWVCHAVVDVARQLHGEAALEEELDDFETVALVDRPVVALHGEVFEHEGGALFAHGMIKPSEVKFIQVGLLDDQADTPLLELRGQFADKEGQLLSKGRREGLRCDRQLLNYSKHKPEASRLAEELSLRVALAFYMNGIGFALGGRGVVYERQPLLGAEHRNLLEDSAAVEVAVDEHPHAYWVGLLLHDQQVFTHTRAGQTHRLKVFRVARIGKERTFARLRRLDGIFLEK